MADELLVVSEGQSGGGGRLGVWSARASSSSSASASSSSVIITIATTFTVAISTTLALILILVLTTNDCYACCLNGFTICRMVEDSADCCASSAEWESGDSLKKSRLRSNLSYDGDSVVDWGQLAVTRRS